MYLRKCHGCLVFFFVCLIFCSARNIYADEKQMDNVKTIVIHFEDNGKELEVNCGDVIQIELEGLGSAGYWWYIDSLDHNYYEVLSEETKKLTQEVLGAPVLGIWRLITKKHGWTEIRMHCYRKWEGIEKSVKHFSITVNIKRGL